jgi:hypothetical protein
LDGGNDEWNSVQAQEHGKQVLLVFMRVELFFDAVLLVIFVKQSVPPRGMITREFSPSLLGISVLWLDKHMTRYLALSLACSVSSWALAFTSD